MSPEGDPLPRARESLRWLAGIAFLGLVAAGVVAAAVGLWRAVDLEEMLRSGGDRSAAAAAEVTGPGLAPDPPVRAGGTFRVALLESAASSEFFPRGAAGYARQVEHWRSVIDSAGGSVTTVSGGAGIRGLEPGTALVVPVAPCLPFDAGMALFRHLRDGGSLVVEGPAATRDEACEWRGWSVLRSLTGASGVRDLGARESLYLTVPAGLPFSHGLAPGSRVELGHDLQIALATDQPGAYWSDWGLSPAPAGGSGDAVTAALARTAEGGGRLAWFGFLATDAVGDWNRERVRRMHESALLWAAGRPLASLAAWPDARTSALLITQDVEAEAQNARVLAGTLRRRGLPGTFFVVSRMVEGDTAVARAVASAGEVGTHTLDHGTLRGRPADDQRVRLERSRETARAWSGRPVRGLRPPEELYDSLTLAAWAAAGGSYVAAENQGRSAAPEIHRVGDAGERVVLLPRVMKDDYNVLVNDGLTWERGLASLMDGLRKVHRLGGLALLNLHTQFVDMGRADELGAALDSVAAGPGWWTATAGEAAGWWSARHDAGVALRAVAPDTLEVTLTAPPDTALTGLTAEVTPPGPPEAWGPAPGAPGARFGRTPWSVRVVVDSLAAGDTARVRLVRTGGGSASGS